MIMFAMDGCLSFYIVAGIVTAAFLVLLRKFMAGGTYHGIETMEGKTVVITGANTGIGKETVKNLAMRGARVIMGCRDMEKGNKAIQEIISETNNKNIENRKLDLGSFASIRAFAKSVLDTESKIDVLINNAGIMMCPKARTEDGLEQQIGVNHFGHFLLTNLLLDKLKQSAPSRIVIISSFGHIWGVMKFDDLQSEKSYSKTEAYVQSKLANILHTVELSKRLEGTGVTVNSLHPGAVNTELDRHVVGGTFGALLQGLLEPVKFLLYKDTKQGAQTTLRLAIDPTLEKVSGKYFSDCREKIPATQGRDELAAKRLWDISESTTKKCD